jgi:hypothetical protein
MNAASVSRNGTSCISNAGCNKGKISATRKSSVRWEEQSGLDIGYEGQIQKGGQNAGKHAFCRTDS